MHDSRNVFSALLAKKKNYDATTPLSLITFYCYSCHIFSQNTYYTYSFYQQCLVIHFRGIIGGLEQCHEGSRKETMHDSSIRAAICDESEIAF